MPISLTSVQKKALLTTWALIQQAPIQFALVGGTEPLLWVYKKPQEAPTAMKVLDKFRKEVTGFKAVAVTVGRVEMDGPQLRVVVDQRRTIGLKLTQAAFTKAWKLGAKLAGLERAFQLIDKAAFGEEEGEEFEEDEASWKAKPAGGNTNKPDLGASGSPPPGKPSAPVKGVPSAVTITRTKVLWTSARSTASNEFDKLLRAIYSDPEVRGNPRMTAAAGKIKKVGWKLDAFDDRILGALDALGSAKDAAAAATAMQRCRAILADYRKALANDPVLEEIDENPFAPVKVRASIEAGISGLVKVLGA